MRSSQTKRFGIAVGLAILVGHSTAAVSWAGSPPPLRFDPFRERDPAVVAPRPAEKRDSDRAFQPVLLSTMVGGERPLANLGGEILGIGDESHGYRLLEVRSFEATFEKEGETLRLEVLVGREGSSRDR